MRILAIRGRNLASLARAFAVELAQGELANAGLFAITGPVGAGKSTLLDALCLALFDRTPRLNGRGGTLIGDEGQEQGDWLRANDPRTLLRRNAVDGYAEVDFVGRDGVPYRSRWSVRRARRRPDGRLQDQELILHDLAQGVVVASGRRVEVLAAIRQRLGLDFSQFCRSVLLAQGEFHAFLHAAADERAKLLETLTGAQLYRRLSRRAHEKRREHEQVVGVLRGQLEQCDVLPDEVRHKLELDAEQLQQQMQICAIGIALAQSYVLWHQDAERRREEEDKAMAALHQAIAQSDAANERRRLLLVRQRAMAAIPRWEVVLEARAKSGAAMVRIADLQRELAASEQRSLAAKQQLQNLLARSFGADVAVPMLVRDFDSWRESLQRWQAAEQRVRAAQSAVPRLQERREQAEQAWQAKVQQGELLLRVVTTAEAELEQVEQQLAAADYDQIASRRRHLAAQQAELVRVATACLEWQRALTVETQARDALAAAEQELRQRKPMRAQAEARLAEGTRTLAAAREQLRIAEQQHGLQALRAQLRDGLACPLCGSLEHPANGHDVADLSAVGAVVLAAEAVRESAVQAASQAASEWLGLQRMLLDRQNALQAAAAARAAAKAAFVLLDAAASGEVDPQPAVARLDRQQQLWADADKELAAIEAQAANRSQAVRTAREARALAVRQHASWREQLEQAADLHRQAVEAARIGQEQVAQARAVLAESRQGLEQACHGLPGGVQAIAALGAERMAALQAMQQCDQEHLRAAAEVAAAVAAVQQETQREQQLRSELAGFERAFVTALSVNQVTEADVGAAHQLGADALHGEAAALQALLDEVARCRTELSLRARLRREHEDHERPTLDAADALRALSEAQSERARQEKLRLDVHGRMLLDDSMRRRRAELSPDLSRAEQELATWAALADLIGSSTGDAFAVFAQGLALDLLLLEADRRLEELARRYRLEKSRGGELEFVVVDLDMGGTRRSLHTLSGGETFLVSLALALALATLAAPRSRVETLFLDEGFGTLDAQNLEIALGALDSLQASGCQVGVISHVDGIAERIGAVVEVRPEGSGQSRVVARGC